MKDQPIVEAAQAAIDAAQQVFGATVSPSENVEAAQALIDEAQKIIAREAETPDEEEPPVSPAAPPPAEPVVPVEIESPEVVEVEFLHSVSLWVNGDARAYPVGKTFITPGELATIRQTRHATSVRG